MSYSYSVRFDRDPLELAIADGFTPHADIRQKSEWVQRQIAARYLDDIGVDVNCTLSPA